MRLPFLPMIIVVFVNLLIDTYLYMSLRKSRKTQLARLQGISAVVLAMMIIVAVALPWKSGDNAVLIAAMWLIYIYFSVYIAKYMAALFILVSSISKLNWIKSVGWVLAAAALVVALWGATVGRYKLSTTRLDVEIAGLPEAFDGFTIVQLSDFHAGSLGEDTVFTSAIVKEVNALRPDLIAFTGDLVNSRTNELLPHAGTLSRLKAQYGVVSVLGNHDYGDYAVWPTRKDKSDNMVLLEQLQRGMGWKLLIDSTVVVHNGNDSIAILGVGNIGEPPFHTYGSLAKTYINADDDVTKILLTHNPRHWTDSIANKADKNIALTLSGHTHAMQIRLFGWSPAKYNYPTWGGLYSDSDGKHQLYVNIGLGTVGLPYRIGANPEITFITLKELKQ